MIATAHSLSLHRTPAAVFPEAVRLLLDGLHPCLQGSFRFLLFTPAGGIKFAPHS